MMRVEIKGLERVEGRDQGDDEWWRVDIKGLGGWRVEMKESGVV